MDYQNEEGKSGKAESLILIRKQSSGSVGSRDSSSNNIDRISLLDKSNGGGDGGGDKSKKIVLKLVKCEFFFLYGV